MITREQISAFWIWFEDEMARRDYRSVRQVERAGGVGHDTISSRLRHNQPPTDTVIRAVARAFGLAFEAVQAVARDERRSAPPPSPPQNLTLQELWGIVSRMSREDQRAVLEYALFRRSKSGASEGPTARTEPAASPQTPLATDGGG
jgi:DNA-binding phage protein